MKDCSLCLFVLGNIERGRRKYRLQRLKKRKPSISKKKVQTLSALPSFQLTTVCFPTAAFLLEVCKLLSTIGTKPHGLFYKLHLIFGVRDPGFCDASMQRA
ncbi:unnamed protein product [Natator depressus]